MTHDLVFAGGRLVDPANDIDGVCDLGINGDRVAEDAGRRHQIHDGAVALGLEHRHGPAHAEELGVDARGHGVTPLLVGDVLDRLRRPGHPGVVDEDVEAAGQQVVEHGVDGRRVADVAHVGGHIVGQAAQAGGVDVAGDDLGPGGVQGQHRGPAHAGPAGSDEGSQAGEGRIQRGSYIKER